VTHEEHRIVIESEYRAPGTGPAGLAWDGTTLWHADFRAGRIFALDPATAVARRSLYCPGNLSGLAWDGHALWQSLFDQEMVRAIDPQSNDFNQALILEGRGWLSGVAHNEGTLWVVAQRHGLLLSVDLTTNETRQLPAPPAAAAGDIDYRHGRLWVAVAQPMQFDEALGRFEWAGEPGYGILEIDPADGRVLARHAVPALYSGLCWADDDLWLADAARGALYQAHLK
jgi:sugar lactone lactonase YvrE